MPDGAGEHKKIRAQSVAAAGRRQRPSGSAARWIGIDILAHFVDLAAQVAALIGGHAAGAARGIGVVAATALLFHARIETACVTWFAVTVIIAALRLFEALRLQLLLVVTARWLLRLCLGHATGQYGAQDE